VIRGYIRYQYNYEDGTSSAQCALLSFEFEPKHTASKSDAEDAIGLALVGVIKQAVDIKTQRGLDVTGLTVDIDVTEDKVYLVTETMTYKVRAQSEAEAEALWLDKGTEVGELQGVSARDITEA
jgi:hypothetical protein